MFNPDRIKIVKKGIENKNTGINYYWMQASQRVEDNFAIEYLINCMNETKNKSKIVFCVSDSFGNANRRHYYFMLQGIIKVKKRVEQLGMEFIIKIGNPAKIISELENINILITDKGYTRIQREWRNQVYEEAECSIIEIEDNVIVPVERASLKEEYGAYTIRPKLWRMASEFADDQYIFSGKKLNSLNKEDYILIEEILSKIKADNCVKENPKIEGGEDVADILLNQFVIDKGKKYEEFGNIPDMENGSSLSPYIHFGQISPLKIYREAVKYGYKEFIEQLFVRRELAVNFVWYNNDYDNFNSLKSAWIYETLEKHCFDKREYIYTIGELEEGKTHDIFWNAAQSEMTMTGYMKSYMRMYWGKKIIEWSKTPEEAYNKMIYLNDKYLIDGRDPNGYAGVAWCFGKHDRPWGEREIFGKVRYMNDSGLKRKFVMEKYVEKIETIKKTIT